MVAIPLNHPNWSAETLPVRTKATSSDTASLVLHPAPDRDALVVKFQPPRVPAKDIHHIPCDIMLAIDVSDSMRSAAPVPGESESTGLCVLDLVKHAALTIIETLDENDRLGIISFSTASKVLQPLIHMTDVNKKSARETISQMQPENATNLWHAIRDAVREFRETPADGRQTRSVMILTDGLPNVMCPEVGYVTKLRSMLPLPATLHTFGFGYNLRVGLLKAIAEIGGGDYAFIPDAGMIGTVFVHAVANLQATFATEATLDLLYEQPLAMSFGPENAMVKIEPESLPDTGSMRLRIPLGNVMYGQERNLFIRLQSHKKAKGAFPVRATLTYSTTLADGDHDELEKPMLHLTAYCDPSVASNLTAAEVAYCESRALLCDFISTLYTTNGLGEWIRIPDQTSAMRERLDELMRQIPAKCYQDLDNVSIVEDFVGEAPRGQVQLAISCEDYFQRWGRLYLPSLLDAHTRHMCNSFKDPGPLRYGVNSPLFITCRDRLDTAFENLPAPTPSSPSTTNGRVGRVNMASYHSRMGPCFGGSTLVELASGQSLEMRRLRRGMRLRTPLGSRKVAAILKTNVEEQLISCLMGVFVTPYHPVTVDGKTWAFPADKAPQLRRYTGSVYSVLLQRDCDPRANAIRVGTQGLWGVTLGHGIKPSSTGRDDVRAHEFLGDYDAVARCMIALGNWRKGVVLSDGVVRDYVTGKVCGFRRPRDDRLNPKVVIIKTSVN